MRSGILSNQPLGCKASTRGLAGLQRLSSAFPLRPKKTRSFCDQKKLKKIVFELRPSLWHCFVLFSTGCGGGNINSGKRSNVLPGKIVSFAQVYISSSAHSGKWALPMRFLSRSKQSVMSYIGTPDAVAERSMAVDGASGQTPADTRPPLSPCTTPGIAQRAFSPLEVLTSAPTWNICARELVLTGTR